MIMEEWKIFIKVRAIMKKIDHPLMVETFNKLWLGFQDLKIKPSTLNNSFSTQEYLRKVLPEIKKQAESCFYAGYKPNKGTTKQQEVVNKNSGHMMEILSVLEQY